MLTDQAAGRNGPTASGSQAVDETPPQSTTPLPTAGENSDIVDDQESEDGAPSPQAEASEEMDDERSEDRASSPQAEAPEEMDDERSEDRASSPQTVIPDLSQRATAIDSNYASQDLSQLLMRLAAPRNSQLPSLFPASPVSSPSTPPIQPGGPLFLPSSHSPEAAVSPPDPDPSTHNRKICDKTVITNAQPCHCRFGLGSIHRAIISTC